VLPVAATGLSGPIRQSFPFNSPLTIAAADFNKDGIEDFVFGGAGGGLVVLLGNGDSSFHSLAPATAYGVYYPSTADFNNDGNTDIVSQGMGLTVDLGDGKGGFTTALPFSNVTPVTQATLAVADFNRDGWPDVVTVDPAGNANVLLGVGDGTSQIARAFPAGTNPILVTTGDFNEDGERDILVVNSPASAAGVPVAGALNILAGNGDGTFRASQQMSIAAQPVAVALADFNSDGHIDFAVAHAGTNQLSVLLGRGDGTFGPPALFALGAIPVQLLSADMNGDGHPDLVVMFSTANPAFAVLYGNGDGTFATPANYPDLLAPNGIAVGDVNGDGRMDVILAEPFSVNIFPGALGSLSMHQGASQTAAVGTPFATVFAVNAPSGTKVTFTAPAVSSSNPGPGGSFPGGASIVTVTADSSGVATAPVFTAGTTPGSYIVLASAQGVAGILSFSLTNNPGPPTTLKAVAGSGQIATLNSFFSQQLAAGVQDSYGNGIAGVTVSFTAPTVGASGTFFGGGATTVAVTDSNGFAASPRFQANSTAGTYNVVASSSNLSGTATFTLTNQPPPSIAAISGSNQSAILGAAFSAPLVARVTDSSGKPMQSVAVAFTAPASGASAMFVGTGGNYSFTTFSDQSGMVSSGPFSAAGAVGSYAMSATLSVYGTSTTFPLTNTANPPGQPQPQSISFPLVRQYTTADPPFTLQASASSGLPVIFSIVNGPATVSGNTLTITGPGYVSVRATQAGDSAFLPADPVERTFEVSQPASTIRTIDNAACYSTGSLAPDEFVSIFGSTLANGTATGDGSTPQYLGGIWVSVYDNTGKQALAGLSYVSPGQVNIVVPEGLAAGPGIVVVSNGSGLSAGYAITLASVAPGLFTADASGAGAAAAFVTTVAPDQTVQTAPAFQCSGSPLQCLTVPINVSAPGSQVYLTLYGTGLRGTASLATVSATIGGRPVTVTYCGAQSSYAGLDQVNLELPASLAGSGQVTLQVIVQGIAANPVLVAIQ
jgi:uncharacterized protein (TIGR03437 family)